MPPRQKLHHEGPMNTSTSFQCSQCLQQQPKEAFSKTQRTKPSDMRRCASCIQQGSSAAVPPRRGGQRTAGVLNGQREAQALLQFLQSTALQHQHLKRQLQRDMYGEDNEDNDDDDPYDDYGIDDEEVYNTYGIEPPWRQFEHYMMQENRDKGRDVDKKHKAVMTGKPPSCAAATMLVDEWKAGARGPSFHVDHGAPERRKERAARLLEGHGGSAQATGPMRRYDSPSPPLVLAASLGNLPWVKALMEAGAHINEPKRYHEVQSRGMYDKEWDWDSDTPLLAAVRNKHYAVARYLLAEGADPTVSSCVFNDLYENVLTLAKDDAFKKEIREEIIRIAAGTSTAKFVPTPMGGKRTREDHDDEDEDDDVDKEEEWEDIESSDQAFSDCHYEDCQHRYNDGEAPSTVDEGLGEDEDDKESGDE